MGVNELKAYAAKNGIDVSYYPFRCLRGMAVRNEDGGFSIGINEAMRGQPEEERLLAHEIGHCMTDSFYTIASSKETRQEAERNANAYALMLLEQKGA